MKVKAHIYLLNGNQRCASINCTLRETNGTLSNTKEVALEPDARRAPFVWTHYEIQLRGPLYGDRRRHLDQHIYVGPEDRVRFRPGNLTLEARRS